MLLHDSSLYNKCLGKVDIGIERLLELQHLQPSEGEYSITFNKDSAVDNLTI